MEAVDQALAQLVPVIEEVGGILVVTADHGNADQMIDKGKPRTSHSLNPVMFSIYDPSEPDEAPAVRPSNPDAPHGLSNVAATCLELLGWAAPSDYDPSLLAS